jgi:integrase
MAGQIIRRSKKTWLVRMYLGRGADGKEKYQNKTIKGVKKDAQTWLTDALRKKDLGIPTFQSKISVSDYIDEWLKTIAKPRVSETTYRGYESQLNHVKNALGKTRLTMLRAQDIQKLYSTLTAPVAKHVHAPLSSALLQAVKWHLIHSNACDAVDLPRHKAGEVQALTRDEASRLMAVERFTRTEGNRTVTVENRYRVLFAFLLDAGCRPSEAFGLKWSDLDFESGRVTIQRTLQWHSKKRGGGPYFEETKTKTSRRSVPLAAGTLRQLREHRAAQAEALLKLGVRTDLVFATSEGTPITRRNLVRRHFKPLLKAAKLPNNLTLYCLRHSCATMLLQANVHPKVVSERLGHASIRITLDIYSHVLPGMQDEATAQIERMLYG